MDKAFVEKVTRMVVEVLNDMNNPTSFSGNNTVKIWPHKSPLPDPIRVTPDNRNQQAPKNEMVNITPYLK